MQRLREIEEAAARTFTKLVVSADQFQRLLLRKNVSRDQIAVVGRSTRGRRSSDLLQAFEEVVHRHVQRDGEFVKTARGHAVRAAFVLLDLLEADAAGLGQLLLGEAQQAPAPVTEAVPQPVQQAAQQPAQRPAERIYLQVGAFENPSEADNLKARLALSGIQASAQRTQLADGRVVHRVRIGPYSKPEDMNPMRSRLAEAGFSASVSRNP